MNSYDDYLDKRSRDSFMTQFRNYPKPRQYTGEFSVQGLDKIREAGIFVDDLDGLQEKINKEAKMSEDTIPDGCEEITLYEVITTYGGDKNNLVVKTEQIAAESEKRAIMQSKVVIPDDWDVDYVTREAIELCQVRVKAKLTEVLAAK